MQWVVHCIENEDPENEDQKTQDLRKRRPTKMKTPYKNEDPLRKRRLPTKMKTPFGSIENEDPENEDLHV